MKLLRRPFLSRQADLRPRIEVLDRLSLGGKKSLLLISIEGRRLLVGVGEDAAPSVSRLDEVGSVGRSRKSPAKMTRLRGGKIVRA
jgi:flagellar biogenesis protein FliO